MRVESLKNESKNNHTESSSAKDLYDKRMDRIENNSRSISKTFNPDKRVENQTKQQESKQAYNPDKRIKASSKETDDPGRVKLVKEYESDLINNSEFKDALKNIDLKAEDFKKVPSEVVKDLRLEFNNSKNKLIAQWEKENGRDWPTYDKDVFMITKTGEKIKIHKAGDRYDAHHMQPLSMGGKNEAKNITPMHTDVHGDHRGVHAKDGAYGKLESALGGE